MKNLVGLVDVKILVHQLKDYQSGVIWKSTSLIWQDENVSYWGGLFHWDSCNGRLNDVNLFGSPSKRHSITRVV